MLLKYWYVIYCYRTLLFQFREPLVQLENWYSKLLRQFHGSNVASSSMMWDKGKAVVKQAFGGQHSNVKKIWSMDYSKDNETLNPYSSYVLVHIMHVLDNASTAYSIVPRISKGECRTRMLHLSDASRGVGWRDVSNQEFFTYNPIVQSLLYIQLLEQSMRGIHRIVYGNSFRVCEPDPHLKLNDLRKRKKGKLCSP